jgi:hypothetical protein
LQAASSGTTSGAKLEQEWRDFCQTADPPECHDFLTAPFCVDHCLYPMPGPWCWTLLSIEKSLEGGTRSTLKQSRSRKPSKVHQENLDFMPPDPL